MCQDVKHTITSKEVCVGGSEQVSLESFAEADVDSPSHFSVQPCNVLFGPDLT